MSKIYGRPIATPMNPEKFGSGGGIKTINGIAPDKNGNIEVAGGSGLYILADGETIADAPADANVVIDPNGTPDVVLTAEQVSALIEEKLGVIENGTY